MTTIYTETDIELEDLGDGLYSIETDEGLITLNYREVYAIYDAVKENES